MKNTTKYKLKIGSLILILIACYGSLHAKPFRLIIAPDSILKTGWYYVSDTQTKYQRQLDKSLEMYYLEPSIIVNVNQFAKFELTSSEFKGKKYPELIIRFDSTGTENWSVATEKSIGRQLALIVNNRLIIAPNVWSKITAGVCIISRIDYTYQDIEEILKEIKREQ